MDETAVKVLFTLAVALLGSVLFLKLKITAGAFVGAVFAVGLAQVVTGFAYFPPAVKTVCSALAGSYLGSRVRRSDLLALKKAPLAAVIMVASLLIYNVFTGWLLTVMTDLDFGSAMLGMAPGGSTELSLVAADMGYNASTVAIMQMFRLAIVVSVMPMVLKVLLPRLQKNGHFPPREEEDPAPRTRRKSLSGFLLALAVGIPAGCLGKAVGAPAGAISFAMLAVAAVNVATDRLYFPMPARYLANSCNGALIGVRMTLPDVIAVGRALPAILLVDMSWVVLAIGVGLGVYRLSAFSLPTALFASAPGGISDMGLIAEDMGGNPTQVTVMQLFRLVCVLTLCPTILLLLD